MQTQNSWLAHKVIQYLIIHLFLTLASLPIIVAWGLPFSYLAPIGNFVFSPVLFIFLLLSSIIFFCEILHIPHGFIAWLLEKTTSAWQWLLKLHGNGTDTLYGFSKPPFWLLITIAMTTFLIVVHPRMRRARNRIIGLLALLCITTLAIQNTAQQQSVHHIPCHGGNVTLIHHNGKTVLIDPGCIGKRLSAVSWVSYTLIPELIAKTGTLTIDHLITLKPGILLFEALRILCDTITIRQIYIPYMYGTLSGPLRIAWGRLYGALQQQTSVITRIYKDKAINLAVDDEISLQIQPDNEKAYREITYPQTGVTGLVKDNPIIIS